MIRFMLSIVDLVGHKSRLHSLSRVLLCLVNGATGQKFSLQPIDPALSPRIDLYLAVTQDGPRQSQSGTRSRRRVEEPAHHGNTGATRKCSAFRSESSCPTAAFPPPRGCRSEFAHHTTSGRGSPSINAMSIDAVQLIVKTKLERLGLTSVLRYDDPTPTLSSGDGRISIPMSLFLARAIVRLKIAECILNARKHMRHKGPQKINPLIVAVRFVKYAAIADSLNITQCVVAVSAPRRRPVPWPCLPRSFSCS